ncbi:MAG: HlyD family secretion protein [Gemmatimonadota bacterium]|nr:HlyD family secretion protein [Gemmatimonadota bacterium]
MRFPSRRWLLVAAGAIVIILPSAFLLAGNRRTDDTVITVSVGRGEFTVTVTTAGELKARQAVKITTPQGAMQVQQWQMRIASLVDEGTVVDSGAVVAQIDRGNLESRLQEVRILLEQAEAKYEQAMLDSALTLSAAREDIRTKEFGLEEKKLAKEQAVYEAPTVQRQAEIEHEKAERSLAQAKVDYDTRTEQARAKMREVGADVARQRNLLESIERVLQEFTLRAPAGGMVIYATDQWSGKKRSAGSQVSVWDPVVAELPDLTKMESVTYINEIDVRKVALGQPVVITLDADPSKRLTGTVTTIANVGEQRPNTDAKVFEVTITVTESDTTLRPGMTTGNTIETLRVDSVLFVPLDAVGSDGDVPIAYKETNGGLVKQEIETGTMNDDAVIIERGLTEGDRVRLTPPVDHASLRLVRLAGAVQDSLPIGGDTALSIPLDSARTDSTERDTTGRTAQAPPPGR